ncbi:MAG TPA: hypothetical protein VHK01_22260 [Lacipirellulaceae bacterium]|jgi:hypothetical protein|nr:hypothetical protein [Lacipirellulaceae bacterium]
MENESLEQIERQLIGLHPSAAPGALRAAVLAGVHRELQGARWDRRLARATAVLLVLGVALNVSIGVHSVNSRDTNQQIARTSSQSLVETAVVVAEATDAATGRRFARQFAAMAGFELSSAEAAAIDAALQRATLPETANRHKG